MINAATGNVLQRIDYDEWGVVLSDTNPGYQPFGFAGGLTDALGLVRFGARDYDPSAGRWTEKDPIRFGSASSNLYEYAGYNPTFFFDPTGLTVLNCSDKPVLVKPEDNTQPIGELPPNQEWLGSPDGVYITPAGPWYKTPGKSYLPDNDVLVGPGGSVQCTSGPCSWPFLGPEKLDAPPDVTWELPTPVSPLPDCSPARDKCEAAGGGDK